MCMHPANATDTAPWPQEGRERLILNSPIGWVGTGQADPEPAVIERLTGNGRLIGLGVEYQWSVLDQFRSGAAPHLPEQMGHSRLEFARMEGMQTEVVEEVVAQLEVAELGAAHEEQDRLERGIALAQDRKSVV